MCQISFYFQCLFTPVKFNVQKKKRTFAWLLRSFGESEEVNSGVVTADRQWVWSRCFISKTVKIIANLFGRS